MAKDSPRLNDYLLILCFCGVLYGLVLTAGGPLTMHEGVLSQTSRHMLADRDWIVPHYGDAPWLERPPLPQWITVGVAKILGRCDQEWIVRIGPALSGIITVLLTVWIGGRLFGRSAGIVGGLILATMYQFVRYSTLAEADIFLSPIVAACMAVFVHLEFLRPDAAKISHNPIGFRPWPMLLFFVLLGMTNLAKGLVFGTAMVLVPIGGFLLWNFRLGAMLRYVWLWGLVAFALVALAWPVAVYQRHPDVLEVWKFDLFGRLHGNYLSEPWWYYFANWFWVVAPWPAAAALGMKLTARQAVLQRASPERFIWCWALLTPVVFSFAHGKHAHYMLHYLAPWGIISATGVMRLWESVKSWPNWLRLPFVGPASLGTAGDVALGMFSHSIHNSTSLTALLLAGWPTAVGLLWWFATHAKPRTAVMGGFAVLMLLYWQGFSYKGQFLHRSTDDTAFLHKVKDIVPAGEPVLVHSPDEVLEGLRMLFYCGNHGSVLHNLTHLRDEKLAPKSDVYLIARGKDFPKLAQFGEASIVQDAAQHPLISQKSRREGTEGDRWTLFHIRLRPDLQRLPGTSISPMQAMHRTKVPDLK